MKPKHMGGVGLRNLNVSNHVCLMKLGWAIYNQSDELWCNILKHKYKILSPEDCMKVRLSDSSLWKDVASTIPTISETGRWIVGDGKNIKAWNDNWLEHENC